MPNDDDEDRGVRAGINMIKRLWEWNNIREKDGKMPIDMGLGLEHRQSSFWKYRIIKTNGLHHDR